MTLSTDHLSNSESANGKRKRSLKKRQTENQILRKAFLGPKNEDSIIEDFLSSFDRKEEKLIREIMNTGGGAARVEIRMSLSPMTKFELIPQQFEDGVKILRSVADRDAVVWIWCYSNNALQKLNNRDGLKKLIEIVHQSVKATSNVLEHKTNIDCDHLKKKIDMKNSWRSIIRINDLPLELIDSILEKSYLLSILRQKESLNNQKDEMVIKLLASVDFCWFQRISRKHFKNVVWSKLKKYYEDKNRLYLSYKNNQQFFEEVLQVSCKTDMTLSTAHLSNSESANGKRKRSLKIRQTENQMLRKAFLGPENEESVFKDFLSSYFPSEQKLIREIMNTGGGAARVEIRMSLSPLTKFKIIPQQLEDREMRILRSLADRDAVVWTWCHSNNALQKLNNRDGLKKLIEIVHQSVKSTSDALEHKTNIDCDHLKKKIVSIPFVFIDFKTELNFKRETLSETRSSYSDISEVIEVTKLKMKIYVLCIIESWDYVRNSPVSAMICVFEDRSPYTIVEEISLRRFDFSKCRSMVSSAKENCLYLLTSRKIEDHCIDEVLRVEIKENEENSMQDPSKWLELEKGYRPNALSISRDGGLMMVSSSSPIILRIYDPDARLRLSVTLHEDILKAYKALETSDGNFIILHIFKRSTEDADDDDLAKDNAIEEESSDESSSSDDSNDKDDADDALTLSEVSRDGKTIIRRFIPQNQLQPFIYAALPFIGSGDLCVDSEGRVFVADTNNDRVIILDSYLRWIGILNLRVKNGDDNEKLQWPLKLFYDEDSHEMIVTCARRERVSIYDLIWK